MSLHIIPIKFPRLTPPRDDFFAALSGIRFSLKEGDVFVVSSKVVAIHQGRTLAMKDAPAKDTLILQEADKYVPREEVPGQYAMLTLKNHTLVSAAGIDESNGNGYYILWPENINEFCKEVWTVLRKQFKIKKLGVVMTDSHSIPQRHGAIGVGIGFHGMQPFKKYKGKKDIFGRKFKFEQVNLIDSLAAAAVLGMGEGAEKTPAAIVRGTTGIKFTTKNLYNEWVVDEKDDIFYPLLKTFRKPPRPPMKHLLILPDGS